MAPLSDALLTTAEVAALLQLHPKQVYRLVRKGLPGRRVGGEWRFVRREVLRWVEGGGGTEGAAGAEPAAAAGPEAAGSSTSGPPPLLAANGDVVVEILLDALNAEAPLLGFVQADREGALAHLQRGAVLAAGSHGKGPPGRLGEVRLARIHLVRREVGLVAPPGRAVPGLRALRRLRFATRPPTAGVIAHLEHAAREAGLDPQAPLPRACPYASHREVVLAVLRGEADVGLATRAWAARAGLAFRAIAEERYGLLVRAADLGDRRVVRLCEVAQGKACRAALGAVPGYDPTGAGDIRYDPDPPRDSDRLAPRPAHPTRPS